MFPPFVRRCGIEIAPRSLLCHPLDFEDGERLARFRRQLGRRGRERARGQLGNFIRIEPDEMTKPADIDLRRIGSVRKRDLEHPPPAAGTGARADRRICDHASPERVDRFVRKSAA